MKNRVHGIGKICARLALKEFLPIIHLIISLSTINTNERANIIKNKSRLTKIHKTNAVAHCVVCTDTNVRTIFAVKIVR